jgi:hypothetical protein
MSNMSYCKMENTFHDLMGCYEGWQDAESESELKYRDKILRLAEDIVDDYGDDNSSEGE